jgi:hypothetical protein
VFPDGRDYRYLARVVAMAGLSDMQVLSGVFLGNGSAVELAEMLVRIADIWDNLVDGDVPVAPADIHMGFMTALFGLRGNHFYRAHEDTLLPVMLMAAVNWRISCSMQATPGVEREMAHADRYRLADVFILMAQLIGGHEHALTVGPVIKKLCQKEDFATFDQEMRARHG